jgi:hypothetical protein
MDGWMDGWMSHNRIADIPDQKDGCASDKTYIPCQYPGLEGRLMFQDKRVFGPEIWTLA